MRLKPLVLLALLTLPSARAEPLSAFLGRLSSNPTLAGARLAANAAQLQAEAQRGGLELAVQGGYGLSEIKTSFDNPALGAQYTTQNSTQLGGSLTLRPFLYGDTADAVTRAELQARQARTGYRSALAGLQAQALLASEQVRLAQESVASSAQALTLAQTLLEVSKTQLERGLISPADLRSAQSSLDSANEQARSANENLALARRQLSSLVGDATLDALPELPLPTGKTQEEEGAEVALENARVLYGQAQRAALPTVNGSYTLFPSGDTSVGVSIESRTFQPKLSFGYQDPSQTTRSFTVPGPTPGSSVGATSGPTQTVQVGLAWGWSPSVYAALDSATQNLESAGRTLEGARQNAVLTRERLTVALEQSTRALALRQTALENAQKKLEEALERQKLGLVSPLVPLQASSELSGAQIALSSARLDRLSKLLAFYQTYSVPIVPG